MMLQTCCAVAVACARDMKLATVNVVDRYELKVPLRDDPSTLDKKYGVAVIMAGGTVSQVTGRE